MEDFYFVPGSVMKYVWVSLRILFRMLDLCVEGIFRLLYAKTPVETLPPINNVLLNESACSIAYKIRTQKVTSEEVVKAFIKRIGEINPTLNCVADTRFEAALAEARDADALVSRSDSKELEKSFPFLGVPFTIKDCFQVKGLRQTAGLYAAKDVVATEDAECVQLMRNAGAIPLAVTNVSELCMWWETTNNVYGRTKNAYDTRRIVGGSSGGEGCVLSAAGSAMGIGSDIGGSIRMPAFFNGIFGHKPTTGMIVAFPHLSVESGVIKFGPMPRYLTVSQRGIVPNHGQQPKAEKELNDYLTTGPMSRFCSDLLPVLRVLAGPNVKKLSLDTSVDISKIEIYYMEDDGGFPLISAVHSDIRTAIRKTVQHFEQAYGIKAHKVQIKKLVHSFEIWSTKMGIADVPSFSQELTRRNGHTSFTKEFSKWLLGLSKHTFAALALVVGEKLTPHPESDRARLFVRLCDELRDEFKELLSGNKVFLYAPHPTSAPYHNQPLFRPFNCGYTAIFNVLGLPVTQVPLGLGSWGVPVGVQIVGDLHNDHLTLAVAAELERAFGGWVSPSVII